MSKLSLCALGAALAAAGLPNIAGAQPYTMTRASNVQAPEVSHVRELSLEDGSHAFIGVDHKLYLRDASGHSRRAPRGHYMTDHGCFRVADDSLIDQATFDRVRLGRQ
jgi:hypothetical protein